MLMYGSSKNLDFIDGIVLNLSSLREGYPRLDLLNPPMELGHLYDRDFDMAYMNYIMSNNYVFKQFFDIIYTLYTGQDIYLLIDGTADWSENLVESLLKLIQQRYGYNAFRIECWEDYLNAKNTANADDFDPYFGISNLDIDKARYSDFLIDTTSGMRLYNEFGDDGICE